MYKLNYNQGHQDGSSSAGENQREKELLLVGHFEPSPSQVRTVSSKNTPKKECQDKTQND